MFRDAPTGTMWNEKHSRTDYGVHVYRPGYRPYQVPNTNVYLAYISYDEPEEPEMDDGQKEPKGQPSERYTELASFVECVRDQGHEFNGKLDWYHSPIECMNPGEYSPLLGDNRNMDES